MKFCIECGSKLPDKAKFCLDCGEKLPDMSRETDHEQSEPVQKEPESIPAVVPEKIIQTTAVEKVEVAPKSAGDVPIDEKPFTPPPKKAPTITNEQQPAVPKRRPPAQKETSVPPPRKRLEDIPAIPGKKPIAPPRRSPQKEAAEKSPTIPPRKPVSTPKPVRKKPRDTYYDDVLPDDINAPSKKKEIDKVLILKGVGLVVGTIAFIAIMLSLV